MPSVSPSQRLSGIRSFVPESGSNKVLFCEALVTMKMVVSWYKGEARSKGWEWPGRSYGESL